MAQKYEWLFKTAQIEYTQLREDCITWIGLVFLDYVETVYKIKLEVNEALVLTDTSLEQHATGLGYGLNLPSFPACKVIHYYNTQLVDDVLSGRADESVVMHTIREFFKDYIDYAKIFIAEPTTFIKVTHDKLVSPLPAKGCIETLKTLKTGKI